MPIFVRSANLVRTLGHSRWSRYVRIVRAEQPIRPETTAALLWEAARPSPRSSAVRASIDGGADVSTAIRAATTNGVGPLLWRALTLAAVADATTPDGAALAEEARLRRAEALLLYPHAVALSVGPLRDRGLEPRSWSTRAR